MSESAEEEESSTSTTLEQQQFLPLMLDKYLEICPDVDTQGDYSFTGVWHSARGFLDFLLQDIPSRSGESGSSSSSIGGNIMELGAGTGWMGITLAQSLVAADAVQTPAETADNDNEEALGGSGDATHKKSQNKLVLTDRQGKWLKTNLEAAQSQGIPGCEIVSSVGLDWRHKPSVRKVANMMPWDWIIGSDLVYTEEGIRHLATAMHILATETADHETRIIYAHTLGRMAELDQQWENELQSIGLTWKVLAEVPLMTHDHKVWEGRKTLIMDIFLADT